MIVPFITWHSLVSSLSPNYLHTDLSLQEGRPTGVFKEQWTSLFFASGNGQVLTSPPGSGTPVLCPNFVDPLCQLYTQSVLEGRATPATIDILKASSPATPPRMGNIDIPTLLVQGQSDTLFTVNEAAASYTALKANGAPLKMIWHNGGHGGYAYAEGELAFIQRRVLAWFDRHLAGDTGVKTGPAFEYHRNWSDGTGATAYGGSGSYPVGTPATLYLSGDGTLQPKPTAATAGDLTFASTPGKLSYTETSNFQTTDPFSNIPPTDAPGTSVEFVTSPLSRPTTVVGIPTVRFELASTIGEAQLFAKLFDVAPDGSATLIRRLVAPIRATELGEIDAQLVGVAHRFAKGHQIRLVLASTDAAYANLRVPTAYTVTVQPGSAQLTLPVVGSASVATEDDDDRRRRRDGGGNSDVQDTDGGQRPTLPVTGGAGPIIPGVLLLAGVALRGVRRRR